MVISETPGLEKKPTKDGDGNLICENGHKCIDNTRSPIWRLFKELFGENNFKPWKNATLYWTHYQKCSKEKKEIFDICKIKFLKRELELLKTDLKTVKLIIGIGTTYAGSMLCCHFNIEKTETMQVKNKKGKKKIISVGLKPTQIDGRKIAILHHPASIMRWYSKKSEIRKRWDEITNLIKDEIQKII